MAAALRLRVAGHDVRLFERNDVLGGKLGARLVDGFTFDTGPSLLTLPHVFDDPLVAAAGGVAMGVPAAAAWYARIGWGWRRRG